MKQDISKRVEHLLESNISFNPMEYISKAFNVVNKNPGWFILFSVLFMLVSMTVDSIEKQIFGSFEISILSTIISSLWIPGIYVAVRRINQNRSLELKNFFEPHQNSAGKLIITGLLVALLSTLPIIPGMVSLLVSDDIINQYEALTSGLESGEFIWPEISSFSVILLLIGFLASLYLSIGWVFALPLALFTKYTPWEAMETSRKVASKCFFPIFGFLFLLSMLILLGVLMLVVGVIYMLPVTICATYIAFEDLFKTEEEKTEEDILEHIVD